MRSVQLLPPSKKAARSGGSSQASLAAIAVGALVVIGGYTGYSQLSSVKAEISDAQNAAAQAQSEAASVQAEIDQAGAKNDFTTLAASSEQKVLTALENRIEFDSLMRELSIVAPGGLWLDSFTADAGTEGGASDAPIVIEGFARNPEEIASYVRRLNSVRGFDNVRFVSSEKTSAGPKRSVLKFTLNANFDEAKSSLTAPDGSENLVGDGTGSGGLSLDPEPGYKAKSKPKKKAAPKPTPLQSMASGIERAGGDV